MLQYLLFLLIIPFVVICFGILQTFIFRKVTAKNTETGDNKYVIGNDYAQNNRILQYKAQSIGGIAATLTILPLILIANNIHVIVFENAGLSTILALTLVYAIVPFLVIMVGTAINLNKSDPASVYAQQPKFILYAGGSLVILTIALIADIYINRVPPLSVRLPINAVLAYPAQGRSSGSYAVEIDKWDMVGRPQTISVNQSMYEQIKNGAPACAHIHRGILALDWYIVALCSSTGQNQ